MRKVNNIPEIRAELLLNYLYPEAHSQWTAQNEGSFFRNYNSDLFSIDEEKMLAVIARDSFMRLLPQGLLTQEGDLKGESVYVEHQIDSLLQAKLTYILNTYFGVDLEKIENHYVREAAVLLPYVSRRRGDFGFIANLLQTLVKCKVQMSTGRYSHSDTTRSWLPKATCPTTSAVTSLPAKMWARWPSRATH